MLHTFCVHDRLREIAVLSQWTRRVQFLSHTMNPDVLFAYPCHCLMLSVSAVLPKLIQT